MSSLRGQRVVIASLFLPDTVVLGESYPSTPNGRPSSVRRPTGVEETGKLSISLGSNLTGLKSIVDDLKDKTKNPTPAILTPAHEALNPFASLPVAAAAAPPSSLTVTSNRRTSRSTSRHGLRSSASTTTDNTQWHIEPSPLCNGGLKNAIDSLRLKRKLWIGTLATSTDSFPPSLRSAIDRDLASTHRQHPSVPVWIPDQEFQSSYAEFCHQVLWPCLHYAIPDAPKTKMFYESASFNQYLAVNQKFADAIVSSHQDGDIIWVNDYHLMLLPYMLRSSGKIPPTTPIGFFMHVAFPSSEIFRCLSVRKDLLRGVLGADLIGFQTANYARHFRQTVSRIMAYEALPKGIQVAEADGEEQEQSRKISGRRVGNMKPVVGPDHHQAKTRFVDVGVFPVGIDVWQLKEKKAEPEVKEWIQLLTQRYAGMKIVVGRDKLDDVQGVRHKIQAFEYFLDKHPEFQGNTILIQIALPTTSPHASTLSHPLPESSAVTDAIHRINSRFSTLTYQPVIFLHTQDLTFSQYLALLSAADAFIVTSLREGMALRTHEYVECQEGRWRPLILSEFTGSYSYSGFRSCIAINPWDTRGTAAAIHQALTMSDEEALTRWEDLHNHVTTQTAQAFVTTFLNRTLRAHSDNLASSTANLDVSSSPSGQGAGNVAGMVPVLDTARVLPRYKHSGRRLILVDLEGTLWKRDLSREGLARIEEDYKDAGAQSRQSAAAPAGAGDHSDESALAVEGGRTIGGSKVNPPEEALQVLERLVEDRKNEVWLLSGLRTRGVLGRIAERIPRLGIVAENGCFIRTPKRLASTRTARGSRSSFAQAQQILIQTPLRAFSPPTASAVPRRNSGGTGAGAGAEGGGDGEWTNMVANFNLTWKGPCLEILNYFTERTPGSFIEDRDASIVWRFWTGGTQTSGGGAQPDGTEFADRQWARRQAAEAQNHIFDSLGERYGLRIIPGKNSFLVLPNNISRSTAVGAILHPGGPARSPRSRSWMSPDMFDVESIATGGGGGGGISLASGGGAGGDSDLFIIAVSGDEKLLRRLNEFDEAETCSTSGRGTDARWRVEEGKVVDVLRALAKAGVGSVSIGGEI